MLAVLGILGASVGIMIIDMPSLWKKKMKKELFVFIVLLVLGMGLCISNALHIHIPNPLEGATTLFKPLSDIVLRLFK
ncbi:hypothetical protein [Paenibacillus ginsengarvi]|uniref:Uncharacterized protein n=1 Tax=Paenibacillus ginsengarvi TaxID=400777 RepID=A0A3B0CLD9_9BACL|nr:hypothetical protein [Paenibacillus ginsengarvi]RKN85344.1 hypothetical protein D7M11_09685 [Paenibacillus ginsengarvi]